ncbi:hypothetical protein C4B68_08220 [Streptomyces dengpaensis]|uniref:Uncharacterized protein n=1 Tax=Streptomyces dengpaensis TaxID=2049881 RepID=A0ABM6SM62_9ACTN|nr:hypothetical protein C4B68_08220 [Streptomyces dengpaensis]PIB12015.1 hypothetical protein B1C81_02160 [Streptomyces sp. HG99]
MGASGGVLFAPSALPVPYPGAAAPRPPLRPGRPRPQTPDGLNTFRGRGGGRGAAGWVGMRRGGVRLVASSSNAGGAEDS